MILGIDEAGRGCLAGPVVISGVILNFGKITQNELEQIQDSKIINYKKRIQLAEIIKKNSIWYDIQQVDAPTIDSINILEATRLGFAKIIINCLNNYNGNSLKKILIDGNASASFAHCKGSITCNNITFVNKIMRTVIKGDVIHKQISAASIIAKVYRDELMCKLDKKYPKYALAKHKGYATKSHYLALKKFGAIPRLHRFSFKGVGNHST